MQRSGPWSGHEIYRDENMIIYSDNMFNDSAFHSLLTKKIPRKAIGAIILVASLLAMAMKIQTSLDYAILMCLYHPSVIAPINQPVEVHVYQLSDTSIHVTFRGVSTTNVEEPLIGYKVGCWGFTT